MKDVYEELSEQISEYLSKHVFVPGSSHEQLRKRIVSYYSELTEDEFSSQKEEIKQSMDVSLNNETGQVDVSMKIPLCSYAKEEQND